MVQGLSGSPLRTWRGGGPLRSRPKSRRTRPRPNGALSAIAAAEERLGLCGRLLHGQLVLGAGAALAGLDHAFGKAAAADHDPQGTADQLGVGQLLPRSRFALVVEHLEAGGSQLVVELVGLDPLLVAGLPRQRDEVDLPGSDLRGPDDAALIGA